MTSNAETFQNNLFFPILLFYILKEVFVEAYAKVCINLQTHYKCLKSYAAAHKYILFIIFFQKTMTAVLLKLSYHSIPHNVVYRHKAKKNRQRHFPKCVLHHILFTHFEIAMLYPKEGLTELGQFCFKDHYSITSFEGA